jgi:glycosyltransferase involved in cell wall biosynthesis
MKINIITWLNNFGLTKEAKLLKEILEKEGFDVQIFNLEKKTEIRNADINIFCERISENHFQLAKFNIFLPNPEWFVFSTSDGKAHTQLTECIPEFSKLDLILCKTHDAVKIFKNYINEDKIKFVSFTSEDNFLEVENKYRTFLHLQGKSNLKGTNELWQVGFHYYDDWSELSKRTKKYLEIFISSANFSNAEILPAQFKYYPKINDDDDFKKAQNKCIFHICPSYYEGFGHYIWEALSCGAIVLTLDAPPMNEFVTNEFGLLIKPQRIVVSQKSSVESGENNNSTLRTTKHHLATMHYPDIDDLADKIKIAFELPEEKIIGMMQLARDRWLDNDMFFRSEFVKAIREL